MFASGKTSAASTGGYQISRSLRFNSADSAYLNRTPASAGNRRTWTWSAWVKRSTLGYKNLFGCGETINVSNNQLFQFAFDASDRLYLFQYNAPTTDLELITTSVYRDVSAWYHLVLTYDTTQATASNRIKVYVNNQQVGFTGSGYPTQNSDGYVNTAIPHLLGRYSGAGPTLYLDAYMTEVNFIDGQALTPSSFGETNAQTGVWQPKAYSGSYGTNGFYLNFSDNSNTTAATLGKDYSGNGNNWTPNGFLVSAGPNNDSLVDVPTSYGVDTGVGGTVRGNYATLNPLSKSSSITLANGNLDASTAGGGAWGSAVSTLGLSSGKWYFEATCGSGVANPMVGYTSSSADINTYLGGVSGSAAYFGNGSAYINGSPSPYGASYTTGDVIGVAIDMDAGTIVCYKNNTTQGTLVSGLTGTIFVGVSSTNGTAMTVNMGQRPFAHTAPSGFKALCTQNLPTPTIGATTATQAGKFFNAVLWTGSGTQTRSITGLDFQPDLTWMKIRADTPQDHQLYDAVRGAGGGKNLSSNTTAAQGTVNAFPDADYGYVSAFDSGGFSVNDGAVATTGGYVNFSGRTYVAWNWRASNTTAVSNTAGTITSQVSANTTSGFSVITYSGSAVAATIGHGLNAVPSMIISKRTGGGNWAVYHTSLGINQYVFLNSTNAANTVTGYWGASNPTSTTFGVIAGGYDNNSGPAVAYCFAPVAGFSAFGSYTGNGSTDGPFVFTGFRPKFILRKSSTLAYSWYINDSSENPYNVIKDFLEANTSSAQTLNDVNYAVDIVSNGFKVRSSHITQNNSGDTYIYMACAENPFKYSLAR